MRKLMILALGMTMLLAMTGCGIFNSANSDTIKSAILEYAEGSGQDKAAGYIDQLVADGKLGSANAEKLKSALNDGIDKLKEELEKEGTEE